MSTLKPFSQKERDYHAYQARQNFLRQQRTIEWELAEALREKQAALEETQAALRKTEAALRETEAARLEIERLKALLDKQRPTD